ncbi:MAG: hypothetical protein JW969_19260 [Spirochaetales bacterium]|nr:hypothetical protein [Spirochaetales bacterium]
MININHNLKHIKKILDRAGEILATKFNKRIVYTEKDRLDLVSDADHEIEGIILNRIRKLDPDAAIYSEEAGSLPGDSEYRWIIDPLDGTANFIFGVPYFNISIALEHKGKIIEGYVYNPVMRDFFYSTEKLGKSILNGAEIQVSGTTEITDALIVFGFSAHMENIKKLYSQWRTAFDGCKKGLGLLSPALNLCNIARGRTDCYIDFGSNMEGHAAGALILKNAGGAVYNYDTTEWEHTSKGIVATNGCLDPFLRKASHK